MRVVGDRVLIRHAIKPAKTSGGVYIPERFRGQVQEGVVLDVGRGFIHPEGGLVPIEDIHPGDRVFFVKHAGQMVNLHSELVRILSYNDVLAVLEDKTVERCGECGQMKLLEVDDTPQEVEDADDT